MKQAKDFFSSFIVWFQKCMGCDTISIYTRDDGGKVYESVHKVMPCMTIRIFDGTDYPQCDKEFTSEMEAWNYFKDNFPKVRIFDAQGCIYFDYFDYERGGA